MQHNTIVYVVDPDAAIGEALTTLLDTYGIDVQTFTDAESFLASKPVDGQGSECLLAEIDLPGANAFSLVRQLRADGYRFPVILLTNSPRHEIEAQARKFGATEVLEKPLINAFLVERLSELLPNETKLPPDGTKRLVLSDGTVVTFRAMRPKDSEIEQRFVRDLSESSKHMRFFSSIKELRSELLDQFTHPDYPNAYAVIATIRSGAREQLIGVARYAPTASPGISEFAVVVADEWQGFGVARQLLHGLTTAAAIAGIETLEGLVLKENHRMLELAVHLGFKVRNVDNDNSVVRVTKELWVPQLADVENGNEGGQLGEPS